MVRSVKGILVVTEPSIKEVIARLDRKERFIIEEVDDTTLFIKEEAAAHLKERIAELMGETAQK